MTKEEAKYWKDLAKSYERTIVALQKGIAEPQTNTAEWIIVGKTTFHYECSICGGAGDKWDKFCKHCGAKMKESEV